jgi:hypothetical protein
MQHEISRGSFVLLSGQQRENVNGYLAALTIYICSRLIIFLAIRFLIHFVPESNSASFNGTEILSAAGATWYNQWDSIWYLSIAINGYQYDGNDLVPQTIFSSTLPLMVNLVSHVPGIDAYHALLVGQI